jgi:hypothetical protein
VTEAESALPPAALGGDTIGVGPRAGAYAVPPVAAARHDGPETRSWAGTGENFLVDGYGGGYDGPVTGETDIDEDGARRHKLVVIGLPLLALIVVVALAWWVGSTLLTVTSSVDSLHGSTPSASTAAGTSGATRGAAAGASVPIVSADVFDPLGDGQPENNKDVPKAYDGDPSTSWSTLEYRGSPKFGNLKAGVGIVLDLGTSKSLSGVTITTTTPGASVEVRTADQPADKLDGYRSAANGKLDATTNMTFAKPVKARFVLVWITGLVSGDNGFSAAISEVAVHAAG